MLLVLQCFALFLSFAPADDGAVLRLQPRIQADWQRETVQDRDDTPGRSWARCPAQQVLLAIREADPRLLGAFGPVPHARRERSSVPPRFEPLPHSRAIPCVHYLGTSARGIRLKN